MASFTGVGDTVSLTVADRGEDVLVSLSGTYNMTILFQRAVGSPGTGAFETIKTYTTANATVADVYTTDRYNETLRLIVSVDTSGTATATLADNSDKAIRVFKDAVGNVKLTLLQSGIVGKVGDHLDLKVASSSTDLLGKTVRINSITNTGTANSFIGFQSKPRQGASMANNVIGGEISAQISNTFALTGSGSIIGLHVDTYVRGTAAGTIAGDVRGQQIELVTDDSGTRTITGKVVGLRFRAAFSATTITSGVMVPFSVEKAEAQTNSKQWTHALELTSTVADVWNDDPTTELNNPGGTVKGYIKVRVNGNDRYIALYEKGNLAD